MKLILELAEKIIEASQKKAKEVRVPMCIAVVDDGGNLAALKRMDGAMLAAINIATDKAYTAAATGFGTHELAPLAQPGQLAYGLAGADRGRMMVFGGGLPLKKGQELFGGVGVSGGLANQDQEVAQAGLEVFLREVK